MKMLATSAPSREYIRFEVVDFHCKALSKTVPGRHKDKSVFMYSGVLGMCANSEIMTFPEEIENAGCPNSELVPDWSTVQTLPWACQLEKGIIVKRVYCEQKLSIIHGAAEIRAPVPRTILRKMCDELKASGYELMFGGELEFTLAVEKGHTWVPAFTGVDILATLQNNKAMDYCYEVEREMETVGVDICTINAEYGEGQMELTFAPKFGLEAADMTATFRTGAKEIAIKRGMRACFMARPFGVEGVGNGGHFNFSLWKAGDRTTNAFHSAVDAEGLSSEARSFLAGVLAHAPAMEAFCAPAPPCYSRHGHWAPVVSNWGHENRMACVRVKANKDGDPASCYMEFRAPSAAANPYLVAAAVIAAGLDGMARCLELPPSMQSKEDGALALPTTLGQSLAALEADRYMVDKLGKDLVRWYSMVKRAEMKSIEERLAGSTSNEVVSAAWQHMYMEFV